MAYAWDNYTRQLVVGWSRDGLSALDIHRRWPWPSLPTVREIMTIQLQESARAGTGGSVAGDAEIRGRSPATVTTNRTSP